jgi:hypothetical protein
MVWQVVWLGAGSDGVPYSCGTAPESGEKDHHTDGLDSLRVRSTLGSRGSESTSG